jgi:hypothetical protein
VRPRTALVLPAVVAEAPRRAAAPPPAALAELIAAGPAAPGRVPVAPNPAPTISPRPAAAAVAALAGAELERLADKVGRIIARRVAIERERRGR